MRLSGRKASSYAPRWTPRQRVTLFSLLGVNLGVFLVQQVVQAYQPEAVAQLFGLSYRGIDQAYAWQFFSALFLHAGFLSFAGSMFLLYFVGRDVESILGQKHFLYLYLGGAIGGELGHLFLMPPTTVLLAASGGIAALVVAFATILPELEVTQSIFFVVPVKLKAKYLGYTVFALGLVLTIVDRDGVVSHSAYLGGGAAGWLYAHLLGFGRPSFLQRMLWRRRMEGERRRQMSLEEFITVEIDPVLEKISRSGVGSLSRRERRTLARTREKMAEPPQ
ncbi:MAG: rhomboid family intramembrane serine protease [Verrucomicrobiota bacterium]|nr:rhomboid family intramembrane serine protease [Verrucomicrobiota bacterium]